MPCVWGSGLLSGWYHIVWTRHKLLTWFGLFALLLLLCFQMLAITFVSTVLLIEMIDKTTKLRTKLKQTGIIFFFFILIFCIHILSYLTNKLNSSTSHHVLSVPHLPPLTPHSSAPTLPLYLQLSFLLRSVSGEWQKLAWTLVSLPPQAFSCLVIYFLHFIADGTGMFYRIGHLIMAEKVLRDGAAVSLCAVRAPCPWTSKGKSREKKRQT